MARPGVYRTDVEKARRALMVQGKHPSIDLVRAELGNTGSRTTIHRFLKEIEAEEGAPPDARAALSKNLQSLVESLASQLQKEADARIEECRAAAKNKVDESTTRAEALRTELITLREKLQGEEASLAKERAAHASAIEQLQNARLEVAQLRERIDAKERREREQDQHLRSLEEKHQASRDALQHFRNAAQEQRTREQRQHDQALQVIQLELRQAGEQLSIKNTELIQLNRDNSRLLEYSNRLQQDVRAVERERDLLRAERDKLALLPRQLEDLQERLANAGTQMFALQEQSDSKESAIQCAQKDLDQTRVDLASARAELTVLREMANAQEGKKSTRKQPNEAKNTK